jgi:hypothetical protein
MSAFGAQAHVAATNMRSANDPGCVKTRLSQGCSELFSQSPRLAAPTSAIGFRSDEIEMKILGARSASEFSHSLDPYRTFDLVPPIVFGCSWLLICSYGTGGYWPSSTLSGLV